MHFPIRHCAVAGVLALVASAPAAAVTIAYSVAPISGDTWEYTYVVTNDDLAVAIEEFAIYFDVGVVASLDSPSAPAGWDPIAIQPDVDLPDDGFFDALALAGGIVPGETLDGFTVRFEFTGPGLPGPQFFEVLDPSTFDVIASGFTTPIPIPGALVLMLSAVTGLAFIGRRRERFSGERGVSK